jgi:predicted transcriptional regulator
VQQWRVSDVMTAPVITTPERAPVRELARVRSTDGVSAVPIVDDDNRVVGPVSQADLPRPHTRPDAAIRRDVVDHVLRRVLWIHPSQVQVQVDAGVVTLSGTVGRRTTAAIAARLAARVPGVVAVVDQIRDTFDDTTLARSRIHRTHPFSAEPFNP